MSARRRPCDNNFLWHPEEFFSLRLKWADQQEERVGCNILDKYIQLIDPEASRRVMDRGRVQARLWQVYNHRHDSSGGGQLIERILSQMLEDFGAEEKVKRRAQRQGPGEEPPFAGGAADERWRREEEEGARRRKRRGADDEEVRG